MFRTKRIAVLALLAVTVMSMGLIGCSGDKGSDPNTRPMDATEKQQHKEKAGD